ncbi:uncharacterized protein METZ01_LOCUS507661, partial [marine metagenome]
MYETIGIEHGIGLAANQIGWDLNIMIVDTQNYEDSKGESCIFINTEILHTEGETIMEEGCLSIPNI